MFSTSSQLKFWTFAGKNEIKRMRSETNSQYCTASSYDTQNLLTEAEEMLMCRHYEYVVKEFCGRFQPPMPIYVVGTSIAYFKRFYLHNSVCNYHPKDIMYTCVYLACKVEEFNVSMTQFVANIDSNREKAIEIILAEELFLMQQLQYQLTIHNPYRPFEGLLLDIKTRCEELEDVECLRKGANDFIDRSLNTDVSLIFAPSQIALAAILSSATKLKINLDSFVTNTLLSSGDEEDLKKAIEIIKEIRFMVKNQAPLNREEIKTIEQKLEQCRNQDNNPEAEVFWQKLHEESFEDDDQPGLQTSRDDISDLVS